MLMTASLVSHSLSDGSSGVDPKFRHRALLSIVVIFLTLSYLSTILRLGTRKHFLKRLGWDDYIIIVAVVFFSIYCGTTLSMFILANGARGLINIPHNHAGEIASLLVLTECFYILTMIALKLSLAIFFLRILIIPWQRLIILTAITLTTTFGIVNLFFAIFQCGYFSDISVFVYRIVRNQCANKAIGLGINYTYAALTTTSDWTCILIPIFVLKESTMPMRRKFLVGGLMIFASLGSVASIVRMLYLDTITVPTGQFFVNVHNLSVWSTIEPGVGITVASLATLRPLFSSLVEKTRRPSVASHTSPHMTASSGGKMSTGATSMQTYTGDGSIGMSSDTTVVAPSTRRPTDGTSPRYDRRTSKEEKIEDIEAEMRAYGMTDLSKPTTLDEEDFDRYAPEAQRAGDREKRIRWFQSQRAVRHPTPRHSGEYMLRRTVTSSRPVSQTLSVGRQQINESVEEWKDDFTLNGQGFVDSSPSHSLAQSLGRF